MDDVVRAENEKLAAALRYGRRGWRIFPLHSVDEQGRCDCGDAECANGGKHPRTAGGFKDATSDEGAIRRWWAKWPDANIGWSVGGESRVIVLDVDLRNGGDATLRALAHKHPELTHTLATQTGGGGTHLIYRHPGVPIGKIGTGIDTKGGDPANDNGYVVLPPSLHTSGALYKWVEETATVAPFPVALLEEVDRAPASLLNARIAQGERNTALTSLAGTMRRRGMSRTEIEAALLETNRVRCDPPLPESEVRGIAVSISKKEPATRPLRESQATQLVRLGSAAEYWHAPEGDAYVTFPVKSSSGATHVETHAVRSAGTRRWLQHGFYTARGGAPSAQAVQDALGVLEGRARFEGPERRVSVRVAQGEDGCVYVHRGDPEWRVVAIAADSWRELGSAELPPDVRFRRPAGMRALPAPCLRGDLAELRRFINVADDEQFALVVGWLVGALRPQGPYALLNVIGEQGTAKTTAQRVLKSLVDPAVAALRAEPRDVRDVMIAAGNAWVPAFDNVSGLPAWFSDVLCRLATGGGFATRELYTDREEVIFDAMRPTMLNGIVQVVTRGDLADRMVMLTLPPIDQRRRMTEHEFWAAFEDAYPRLLGALYTAVARALRDLPITRLEEAPRMADFATFVVAAEPELSIPPGAFMRAYTGNRAAADQDVIDTSAVAQAIVVLVKTGRFEGTATALLGRLSEIASQDSTRDRAWPRTAQHLTNALRRLAPNLRNVGIDIDFRKEGKGRTRIVTMTARQANGMSVRTVRSVSRNPAERAVVSVGTVRADAADAAADAAIAIVQPPLVHHADDADDAGDVSPESSNASLDEPDLDWLPQNWRPLVRAALDCGFVPAEALSTPQPDATVFEPSRAAGVVS